LIVLEDTYFSIFESHTIDLRLRKVGKHKQGWFSCHYIEIMKGE
jgi:hypothetical protein